MLIWCSCWHSLQVAKVAGDVDIPPFEPRKGVQIETDPKATKVVSATQDDESAIESLISSLEVSPCICRCHVKYTFIMAHVLIDAVTCLHAEPCGLECV